MPEARSSGCSGVARALGVSERERDRDAHVGIAEVRESGAVAEADERVHDRGRVHDHLDPLVGKTEQEVRLDQLEPLVGERGRVDRDLRPHLPGRVRERLLGRDVARARRALRPRKGPPEAVRTTRGDLLGRSVPPGTGRCAECSLSTGSSSPPPRFWAASASSPAATRLSLLASASVTPCSSAHRVARQPAKPTTAFSTRSGSHASSSASSLPGTGSARRRAPRRARRRRAAPAASAHSSSSGFASTISIAWRPIEPVAPRRAIRFMLGVYGRRRRAGDGSTSGDVSSRRGRVCLVSSRLP